MKISSKPIKEKVKAKAKALKEKLKGSAKKCAALVAVLCVAGCMDTNPASRQNSNRFGDVEPAVKVVIGEGACSNVVNVTMPVTIGDGVLASADSSGSTETQTATPTLDIRTKVDARYNDALAAATPASKAVLSSLGEGLGAVLDLMASKKDGKVNATTNDGKNVVVECANGQCKICEDCTP